MRRPYSLKQTTKPSPRCLWVVSLVWFQGVVRAALCPAPARLPALRMRTDARGATSGEGGSGRPGEDRGSRATGDKRRVAPHLCHVPGQASGEKPSSEQKAARGAGGKTTGGSGTLTLRSQEPRAEHAGARRTRVPASTRTRASTAPAAALFSEGQRDKVTGDTP